MEIRNCEKKELIQNVEFLTVQTVMFWIKLDKTRDHREIVVGCDPHKFSIVLEKSGSNQISFYCGNYKGLSNGDALYKAYTGRLPYNKWQHITMVRNTEGVKVYVNCKLRNSYIFDFKELILNTENIQFGLSNYYYLKNLTQPMKDFKIINQELNELEILQYANNYFKNYYTNDYSIFSYFLNTGDWNYRMYPENVDNMHMFIYNDNIMIDFKRFSDEVRQGTLFESTIKFNHLSDNNIHDLIDKTPYNIVNINDDPNKNIYIENILTWQYGMYQDTNPKRIPESNIDCIGSWSCDVTNFFSSYKNSDEIPYARGTFQEGTGTWIKTIIDYYLNNKDLPLALECLQSIKLFIGFLNKARYSNGGIPLYFPLTGDYHDMITLNDCAMINYIRCCEYILNSDVKDEIDSHDILLLNENYNKSLNCLLDLQYVKNGKKTIWPQQADPITLLPAKGRSFELVSICSLESVQILIYLMSLPNQSDIIKDAIINGCEWFKTHSVSGYKQHIVDGNITLSKTNDNVRLLWGRYYTLDNETPVFFDRDGNSYNLDTFNDMPIERRNGYNWLGTWGNYLLEIYEKWSTIN